MLHRVGSALLVFRLVLQLGRMDKLGDSFLERTVCLQAPLDLWSGFGPDRMRLRSIVMLGVALMGAAASVACSSGEPQGRAEQEPLGGNIRAARDAGATEEQVAVLAAAREAGEVTFEAYSEAVDRALRCMREASIDVFDGGTIEHLGLLMRSYSVPAEAEEADSREPMPGITVHRCVAEHSIWVEFAYQLQPASVEAQDAHFDRYREAIFGCLAERGVEVDPALREVATEAELAAEFRRDPDRRDTYGLCLSDVGYLGS
jgi:hypothetical protein